MGNERTEERRYSVEEMKRYREHYNSALDSFRCAIVDYNFSHLCTKEQIKSEAEEALAAIIEYENRVPEEIRELFEMLLPRKHGFRSRARKGELQEIVTETNERPEELL